MIGDRLADDTRVRRRRAHTGAARGPIHHHVPGGKDERVQTAARSVRDGVAMLLDAIEPTTLAEVVDSLKRQLRRLTAP